MNKFIIYLLINVFSIKQEGPSLNSLSKSPAWFSSQDHSEVQNQAPIHLNLHVILLLKRLKPP